MSVVKAGFSKDIQGQWFDEIVAGRKTVEGRVDREKWGQLKPGDRCSWFRTGNEENKVNVEIKAVRFYYSLSEYILQERREAAPQYDGDITNIRDAYLSIVNSEGKQIFNEARVAKRGIVAIEFTILSQ